MLHTPFFVIKHNDFECKFHYSSPSSPPPPPYSLFVSLPRGPLSLFVCFSPLPSNSPPPPLPYPLLSSPSFPFPPSPLPSTPLLSPPFHSPPSSPLSSPPLSSTSLSSPPLFSPSPPLPSLPIPSTHPSLPTKSLFTSKVTIMCVILTLQFPIKFLSHKISHFVSCSSISEVYQRFITIAFICRF